MNGKKYGVDKFIKLIREAPDLNPCWLFWNEGGDKNMLRGNSSPNNNTVITNQSKEFLLEIENYKSIIENQNTTMEVYKNAMEITKSSIEDLRKMVDFYSKNDASDKNDQLNINAG